MLKNNLKKCDSCAKEVAGVKTVTSNNVRYKYCPRCLKKEKDKILVEKRKKARESKRLSKSISKESILKDIQLLVRLLGPDNCVTCNHTFDSGKHLAHGGHFKSRRFSSTAFLIENISKQCSYCNSPMGGQGEEWRHGIYLDSFWGNGTSEKIDAMSRVMYKFTKDALMDIRLKVDEWLRLAQDIKEEDKDKMKHIVKEWQESQYWYKEIKSKTLQ